MAHLTVSSEHLGFCFQFLHYSFLFGFVRHIKLAIRQLSGARKYSVSHRTVSYRYKAKPLNVRALRQLQWHVQACRSPCFPSPGSCQQVKYKSDRDERQTVVALRASERRHIAVTRDRVPLLNADSGVQTDRLVTACCRLCDTRHQQQQHFVHRRSPCHQ